MTARSVQRATLTGLLVMLGLVAVTGVWLVFAYQPSAAAPWNDVAAGRSTLSSAARLLHRWAAILSVLSAVGFLAATLACRYGDGDRRQPWLAALALVPLLLALQFTGYLLPWDQLGLWAVTIGSSMKGMLTAAFDDRVRFILIDAVEITQGTFRLWLAVHTVVLTVTLTALLTAILRRLRRERHSALEPGQTVVEGV